MDNAAEVRDRLVRVESKLSRLMEVLGFRVDGSRFTPEQYTVLVVGEHDAAYGPFNSQVAGEIWAFHALNGQPWHIVPLNMEV